MDIERNKDTVRRVFEEGFGQGDAWTWSMPASPRTPSTATSCPRGGGFRAHLKGVITMLRAAMPDLSMTVEDLIAEGDRVTARVVMTGTHTGDDVLRDPGSGNAVRVEQFHIVQCDDAGRGTVHWAAVGEDDLMRQLAATTALSPT